MTTFAQPPYTAAPSVPYTAAQQPQAHQQVPTHYGQQRLPGHQQLAPPMQQYPVHDQQYRPSEFAPPPVQMSTGQRPAYPFASANEAAVKDAYAGQLRPTLEPRPSYSSHRSARSHKSTRSAASHKSAHSNHSHKSHRSHQSANDDRQKKRSVDSRPTMGDSVMLVFNHFRNLLSGDRR